jgi:hypothetical protein
MRFLLSTSSPKKSPLLPGGDTLVPGWKKNKTKKASSREDAIVEHHTVSNRSLAKQEAAVNQEMMKIALLTLRIAAGMIWSKSERELSAFSRGPICLDKASSPEIAGISPFQPTR